MDKLENQEELYHSTLQPPLLCIDVYKSRNKVDSSYMVREFVAYKWFDQIIQILLFGTTVSSFYATLFACAILAFF